MKFQKGHPEEISYPVKWRINSDGSELVSPTHGRRYRMKNPYTSDNIESFYQEAKDVRDSVVKGKYPHEFMKKHYPWDISEYPEYIPQPLYSEGLSYASPQGLADVVHMDNPFDLAKALMYYALTQGAKPKRTTIWSGFKDFVNAVPKASRVITKLQHKAVVKGFKMKYYFGVVRPEELHNDGAEMTAYEEGCPCHPSFPAGHGCLAGAAAKAIIDYYELPDKAIIEIRNAAYVWSMARTFAFVHYAPDNVAGLEVGGLLKKGYTNKRYARIRN